MSRFSRFSLLSLLLLIYSCTDPVDTRKVRLGEGSDTSNTNQGSGSNSNGNGNGSGNVNNNGNTNTTTTPNGTINSGGNTNTNTNTNSNVSQLPAEFANCQVAQGSQGYTQSSTLIGSYNICKSNITGSNRILFQNQNSISDYRLCFYPTSSSGGGSVMIGNGQCLFATAQRVEVIQFSINRQGFTTMPLTGVMIVKDMPYGEVTPYHNDLVNNPPTYSMAYEDCMIYLYNTGDAYACQRFKEKGNYISPPTL